MRAVTTTHDAEIRRVLVDALRLARVESFRDDTLAAELLAGRRDVSLASLELDSLAAMELCIAIELRFGIEIVPFHLHRMKSFDRLVAHLRRRL